MFTIPCSKGLLFWLSLPLLGPVYTLPVRVWRFFWRHVRSRFLRALLVLPGIYAMLLGPLTVLLSQQDGRSREMARSLAWISPFHMLGRDIFLSLLSLAVRRPIDIVYWLPLDWVLVTAYCTLFLSPLYLWLAQRRYRPKQPASTVTVTT